MNCVIDVVETNTNLNKNDFRITENLRKKILDTIWTIVYYNERGGKKFIEQQKAKGRDQSQYTGVKPCREKSKVIQSSVNELIDDEELYNQFIDDFVMVSKWTLSLDFNLFSIILQWNTLMGVIINCNSAYINKLLLLSILKISLLITLTL